MTSAQKKVLVVTRDFDAPVALAWHAWSDSEHVKQWWGPTGFTCPVAEIDFREGGTSLVCMRAPKEFGGQDMFNIWTYTKIVPQQRIEFVFHFCDPDGNRIDPAALGLPPGMPAEVHHVVTFDDLGNGKSRMTVQEDGYESDQIVELSQAGLGQCLDKMAASFVVAATR
ncbi:MAG: SRPBCC family protein [Gemmatimonadaceae bacterium]